MPKRAQELTARGLDAKIATAAKANVVKFIAVGGVAGLHLRVQGNNRSWILRYLAGVTEDGKPRRRDAGLGSYPDVPLAEARESARKLREQLRQGVDPIDHKRAQAPRVFASAVLTFHEATRRYIAAKSHEWKNAKHKDQWTNTLKTYADPIIGKLPVDQIGLREVEAVLSPIWTTKTETASRVRQRVEAVLDWSTVSGHRSGENPARWRGNLEHVLAKPGKVKKSQNQPALPIDSMPRFMAALRKRDGAAKALEFAILTATRSGELRGARWDEIDLDSRAWTIPAARMKADREHVVPLSPQAVALLEALPRFADTGLVFPGARGQLSDATLAKVIKLMDAADQKNGGAGYRDPKQLDDDGKPRLVVPHGFRSTFRDWASERTNYPRDVAEMALAHTIENKVEAAYRRGALLTKRAQMMNDWAEFLQ